jgi:hypothetical protein
MSEYSECVPAMEYSCSICSGNDVRPTEPEGIDCDSRVPGKQCVKTTKGPEPWGLPVMSTEMMYPGFGGVGLLGFRRLVGRGGASRTRPG